jgi:hypothetical protein
MKMNLVLRLPGKTIDGGRFSCRGSQLASVVTVLSTSLADRIWYVTDVDALSDTFHPLPESLTRIGESQELIECLRQVDQFLRGVFLAVKAEVTEPKFRPDMDTEDPIDADLGSAVVEIRAFDTAYIEVITSDKWIADFVAETFGVQIIYE